MFASCVPRSIVLFLVGFVMVAAGAEARPINSFVYQLQDVKSQELLSHNFDIAVVDWEFDGLTAGDLQKLHKQNKKIVSYLSIGEAEEYRDYWKEDWKETPPAYVERENPDWEGNFKVKYWDPAWQLLMLRKVDGIVDAGYDGMYLDIVDAYYYFQEKGRTHAKKEMVDFVAKLASHAKAKRADFLVIPQNAVELVAEEGYLNLIDGIGKESTWFIEDKIRSNEDMKWELPHMENVVKADKFVLATDYIEDPDMQCKFIELAREKGFVPYVGVRALDMIVAVDCE